MPIKKTIEKDSKEAPKTTKKMTSYMFFCQVHRAEVKADLEKLWTPSELSKEIMKKLGEMWSSQTEVQKNEYQSPINTILHHFHIICFQVED
jgi:hypothetical protein